MDVRSYLLHLKLGRTGETALEGCIASLEFFYAWAQAEGLVKQSLFDKWDFDQPLLDSNQIRRRAETLSKDPTEREIARLQALNRIAALITR